MRPVRNVLPRAPRDEEENPVARGRGKKAGAKARTAQAGGAPRPAGRGAAKVANEGGVRGSSLQPVRRKRPAPVDADSDLECGETGEGPATLTSANHNKYCHFCQHVKVRASSMLACQNQECCRRFCEHCLITHLSEDVDPMSSCAWSLLDGKPVWHCPICRKKCCCSQADCKQDHRHCKAYRYRRRRAELATKRMSASSTLASGEKRVKKSKEGKAKGLGAGPIMRPALTFGFVRSNSTGSIDSPPCLANPNIASPSSSRPRREAALKGRCYSFGDEDDEDMGASDGEMEGDEDGDDNISTPAAGEPEDHDGLDASEHPGRTEPNTVSCGPVCDPQDHVTGDLWTMGESRLGGSHFEDHVVEDHEDEHSESLADDVLGGIYGHMSQSRDHFASGDYELGTSEGGVLNEEEGDAAGAEMDEARWIRRTYETVYNPAARQKALQALTSDLNLGGQKTFSLPPPGRYPLDEGELFFLSSSRPLDSSVLSRGIKSEPSASCAVGPRKGAAEGGSSADGSDLFYFLQSRDSKFPRIDGAEPAAGPVRKCTVMYDFQ